MIERKKFLIVKCPRCGSFQIVNSRNKSKSCSQCSRRFEVADLAVLAIARDARGARIIVSKLKMPKTATPEPKVI